MSNPVLTQQLESLALSTSSARGKDGTDLMLSLKNTYYRQVSDAAKQLIVEFWGAVNSNATMSPKIDALRKELTELDEQCIVPRPELITTPKQCDDIIWELSSGLARIGRIWTVAHTARDLCDYELSVIEKWLREKYRLEDTRTMDAMIGVTLQDERRYIVQLGTLEDQAERTYKRIETQLPSLRDLSDRRYQESRYHNTQGA